MTEKQKVLSQLRQDLGVRQVNYIDEDTIQFAYMNHYIHIQIKKASPVREKPNLKHELGKMQTKKVPKL